MSLTTKIIGALAVSRGMSALTPMLLRLLANMAAIAVCAVMAIVTLCLLVINGVWILHVELLSYGYDAETAALVTAAVLVVLFVPCAWMGCVFYNRHAVIQDRLINIHAPSYNPLLRIASSFLDGFERKSA
jgi:hypothetical protein